MASIKLNTNLRQRIKNALVSHAFDKREKELEAIGKALGDETYYKRFPLELSDPKVHLRMCDLPDGWMIEQNYMYINAGGYTTHLYFSSLKRLPHSPWDMNKNYDITDIDLIHRIQIYLHATKTYDEERQNLRNKIGCFLNSVSTMAQFYTQMPEAIDILGKDFFGVIEPTNALVTTAKEIMCEIAHVRNEQKEGCCNGKIKEENV